MLQTESRTQPFDQNRTLSRTPKYGRISLRGECSLAVYLNLHFRKKVNKKRGLSLEEKKRNKKQPHSVLSLHFIQCGTRHLMGNVPPSIADRRFFAQFCFKLVGLLFFGFRLGGGGDAYLKWQQLFQRVAQRER